MSISRKVAIKISASQARFVFVSSKSPLFHRRYCRPLNHPTLEFLAIVVYQLSTENIFCQTPSLFLSLPLFFVVLQHAPLLYLHVLTLLMHAHVIIPPLGPAHALTYLPSMSTYGNNNNKQLRRGKKRISEKKNRFLEKKVRRTIQQRV